MNTINNYNTSTELLSIDLVLDLDDDLANHYFDESFIQIKNDYFLFTDFGNFHTVHFSLADVDNYDLKSITISQLKCWIYENVSSDKSDLNADSQHYFGLNFSKLNKNDLIQFIKESLYSADDFSDFLLENVKPKFEVIEIKGYSQGDRANIIFKHSDMVSYNFADRDQFIIIMSDYFTNLFYKQPLIIDLTVNDDMVDLTGYLNHEYEYNKQLIINASLQAFDHLNEQEKAYLNEYLNNNLPTYF